MYQSANSAPESGLTSTVNPCPAVVASNQFPDRAKSALVGGLAFTDSGLQCGSIYYYVTTAVDATGNESNFSNQVTANIP